MKHLTFDDVLGKGVKSKGQARSRTGLEHRRRQASVERRQSFLPQHGRGAVGHVSVSPVIQTDGRLRLEAL